MIESSPSEFLTHREVGDLGRQTPPGLLKILRHVEQDFSSSSLTLGTAPGVYAVDCSCWAGKSQCGSRTAVSFPQPDRTDYQ